MCLEELKSILEWIIPNPFEWIRLNESEKGLEHFEDISISHKWFAQKYSMLAFNCKLNISSVISSQRGREIHVQCSYWSTCYLFINWYAEHICKQVVFSPSICYPLSLQVIKSCDLIKSFAYCSLFQHLLCRKFMCTKRIFVDFFYSLPVIKSQDPLKADAYFHFVSTKNSYRVFRKNCVFLQFPATPPSPTQRNAKCTVTPIGW